MDTSTSKRIAGMTYVRRSDGIHEYRFDDNRRETVEAWIQLAYDNDLTAAAAGEIACHFVDLRGHWVTPYAVVRIAQTADMTPPGLTEWIAVLATDNIVVRMLDSIIHKFPASVQMSSRVFRTEDEAIAWLVQKQHEHNNAKSKS